MSIRMSLFFNFFKELWNGRPPKVFQIGWNEIPNKYFRIN